MMMLLTIKNYTAVLNDDDYIEFMVDDLTFCISKRDKNIVDITDTTGKIVYFTLSNK